MPAAPGPPQRADRGGRQGLGPRPVAHPILMCRQPHDAVAQGCRHAVPISRQPGGELHGKPRVGPTPQLHRARPVRVDRHLIAIRRKRRARPVHRHAGHRRHRIDRSRRQPHPVDRRRCKCPVARTPAVLPIGRVRQSRRASRPRQQFLQRADDGDQPGIIRADLQRRRQQLRQAGIVGRGADTQPVLQFGKRRRGEHRRRDNNPHHARFSMIWGKVDGRRGNGGANPGVQGRVTTPRSSSA